MEITIYTKMKKLREYGLDEMMGNILKDFTYKVRIYRKVNCEDTGRVIGGNWEDSDLSKEEDYVVATKAILNILSDNLAFTKSGGFTGKVKYYGDDWAVDFTSVQGK